MDLERKMIQTQYAPVVLFVYNRPLHTRSTIEALQKNELAQKSDLFIYSDAPRNEAAIHSVNQVREYIKTIDGFKNVTIVERQKNWGLSDSIIDGVTHIANNYGKIIVLEDDLYTSKYFLTFMNDSLDYYEKYKDVWHISGYGFPLKGIDTQEYYLIKPATCWGWATWSRAWSMFEKNPEKCLKVFNKKMISDFNLNNSYDYFHQIRLNYSKKINTWAVFWNANVYLNNGLCLHPTLSFVNNTGNDGSGENCQESTNFSVTPLIDNYKFVPVAKIEESKHYRVLVEEYLRSLKTFRYRSIIKKILRR